MWAGRAKLSVSKNIHNNNNNNNNYNNLNNINNCGWIRERNNSNNNNNNNSNNNSNNNIAGGVKGFKSRAEKSNGNEKNRAGAYYYSPLSALSPSPSSLLSPRLSPSLFHFSPPSLSMMGRMGERRMSSKRDEREEQVIKAEEEEKEKKEEEEKNREGEEKIEVINDVEELPPTPPNSPDLHHPDDLSSSSSTLLEGEAIERDELDNDNDNDNDGRIIEDDGEDDGEGDGERMMTRDGEEGLVESEGGNGGGEGMGGAGGVGGGRGGRKRGGGGRGAQIINSSFYAPMAGFKVPSKVPIFPFSRRPIFPGVLTPLVIHDKSLAQKLLARKEKGHHFIGVFLAKVPFDPVPPSDKPSPSSSTRGAAGGESSSSSGVVTPSYQVIEDPSLVHSYGVLARVERIIFANPASGGATVMLTGVMRIKLGGSGGGEGEGKTSSGGGGSSSVEDHLPPDSSLPHYLYEMPITRVVDKAYDRGDSALRAYTAEVVSTIKEIVKLNPFFKEQLQTVLDYIDLSNPGELADLSACLTTSDATALQEVLEESDVILRLSKSLALLKKELEISQLQMKIHKQLESQMQLNQRKYFLNEQLKAIKKELGIETDEKEALVEKFTKRLEGLKITETVQKAIDDEITKLSSLDPSSSEFNVTRTYLDWITSLPWGITNPDSLDVPHAQKILDEDHYGLKDIKERILEFIAVGKMKGTLSGKILCFVGPPGVGKTSIGKSISRALGREFFRFSVGGMQDVAEIKGHRRTYVGAMPGKIIQSLKRVGTSNPVILLDEVDKIGKGGYQGDPASALLEVLDPSQNKDFLDHYLDLPFDLSKVLFICTANVTDTIPGPLLDRMEVLRLSGYVNQEKFAIAKQYLIPSAREETGVTSAEQGVITESALHDLVQHYCRESGVRNLQKHIEKVFRKMAFKITQGENSKLVVNAKNLAEFVGKRVFPKDKMYDITPPGVVTGLAWTSMGGATLYIETAISPSSSSQDSAGLYTTGQMGDVMKESTKIAYSFAKHFLLSLSHLPSYLPYAKFFESKWLHMHIPEGATPKDGPSAGITMVTSLMSLAINQPVRQDLAMTGELSLTGLVLPIGGVKEKVLAAKRSNVKYIIFPKANLFDWEDLEAYLKEDLTAFFVEHYRDVFTIAFGTEEELHAMIPRNKSTADISLPSVDLEL